MVYSKIHVVQPIQDTVDQEDIRLLRREVSDNLYSALLLTYRVLVERGVTGSVFLDLFTCTDERTHLAPPSERQFQ